ncbi:hypothetical protein PV367_08540 [Streptomyces europaeiscabiei]|uniref:Uncharacterized protein n=1 Tax=Streptomyces europaeiscabiei TaxID=146819 RepID=A0AAJ2PM23_9ACTN|nr:MULTISPECIES: hypothetical protein [Streptomyces]MDX3129844.1 hypothetical protein [Streptomyces europaeiscabiei]
MPLPPTVLAATTFTAPAALHRPHFRQNAEPALAQASARPTTAGPIVQMLWAVPPKPVGRPCDRDAPPTTTPPPTSAPAAEESPVRSPVDRLR